MTPAARDRARRMAAVDGLRAVAALSVVGYHAWLYTQRMPSASNVGGLGGSVVHEFRLGLVLFFVLSGFLLYQPWLRSALEGEPAPRLGGYLMRRGARIVPAYYLALAGSLLLLWGHNAVPGVRLPSDGSDIWLFAVFGQNFTSSTLLRLDPPMWTLAVEMSFYLALPLLGWLSLRLRGRGRAAQLTVPLAFATLGLVYNWSWAAEGTAPESVSKVLPAMAPYFAIGMLAAVLAHGRAPGRRAVAWLLGLGALAVVADASWAAWQASHGSHAVALKIFRDDLAAAGFGAVVVAAARARSPLTWLAARPVAWLGRVSYGVYLWHVPVLLVLRIWGILPASPWLAVAAALPPTLLIAAASWRFVERPILRRAHRATRRSDGTGRGRVVAVPSRA
jgi:peptidoglycan/LPS O-acetylase OafA/YrhL